MHGNVTNNHILIHTGISDYITIRLLERSFYKKKKSTFSIQCNILLHFCRYMVKKNFGQNIFVENRLVKEFDRLN